MAKIIINEFYRGGNLTTGTTGANPTAGDEFIELLLTQDLTAAELNSFFVGDSTSSKAAKFSAYDFTNTGSIANIFKAGTLITVGGTASVTQDTTYNPAGGDWNIALNAGGSFLPNANSGNTGDIAGNDVVWVDTVATGATISADGFAVDIGTDIGAFTSAANVDFGNGTNNTGYALNTDEAGATNTANWTTGIPLASTTPGQPNGGNNTTYINNLRSSTGSTPSLSLSANPTTFSEAAGASAATGTVSRTGDTTNALTVNLTSSDTTEATVPATVIINAGQSSTTFAIAAIDDEILDGSQTVTLTASASGLNSGTTNVTVTDNETGVVITKIHDIQGTGATATSGTFTIEGIVVGDFQGTDQLGGFYLQEEDADADNNVLTSEGIFVNSLAAVNIGDRVRVTGTVVENSSTPSFNQAVITPSSVSDVTVLATGQQALVTSTVVDLPTAVLGDLERYEGMLVNFPETLTVTEVFNLGRFGEVSLSANGRLFNPTNIIDPNDNPASGTNSTGTSNVAAVTAQQDLNNRSRIILDDGSNASNLSDVPYIDTTDANPLNDTLRIGSTITNLTGVLGFGFSNYRIQPTQTPTFNYAARPALPNVGGNVKVSSFNVLNYFNGDGQGGGFPTSRGADTAVEFSRQRAKIISAIQQLNADVVGLIEIENDGDGPNSAIADLVNGLNSATAPGTYASVPLANTTGSPGTDEIKVAFIYKPGAVTPVGNAIYFNDSAFSTARPPLAQTFRVNTTNETFTPIINHFKSKGSAANLPGDADQNDGQGLSNATRKAQSTALLNFISQIQITDSNVMVLGDLNAYSEEDPIDILRAGGLTRLATSTDSYVFDGQTGSLDHTLVTSSLLTRVKGAANWNINSDEPIVLDYNDDVLTPGEAVAEDRNDTSLYQANAFRSSDHDPILVGLNFGNTSDPITGTTGNDVITATPGAKTLTGGAGNDQFVYNSIRDAGTTISDFTVGSDRIVLTNLLDSLVGGNYNGNAIDDGYVRVVQGSGNTASSSFIEIDRDGTSGAAIFRPFIQVENISLTALNDSSNFIF
jgi:hypothetical protein